jgi:ribose transport system permease protein
MNVAAVDRKPILRRLPAGAALPAILIAASVLVYVAAAVATGQTAQLSTSGVMGLLQRTVALGFVAIGQTLVLLVGSIDLSVANLVSLAAVLASHVMNGSPGMILPGILAAVAAAALVGLANGLLVARFNVSPLIATLGMALILQGLLSTAYDHLQGSAPEVFQVLAYGNIAGISYAVLLFSGVALAVGFMLARSVAGARLYSVGGNRLSARLAGIRTTHVIVATHVAASVAAAIAGLYLASRLGKGTPWVGRDGGYDLDSIAVVVIGGTLLSGGKGGLAGTLAGVVVFSTIDAVFNMLQIDPFLGQMLRGLIVVASVAVYTARSREHVA